MAAHVRESAAAGGASRLVVEVVVVRYLSRVLPVRQTGALQMINLAVQFLLASLQLLELLETFPGCVVDDHFLVRQLLTFSRHHATFVSVLGLQLQVHLLLLLLLLQLEFVLLAQHAQRQPSRLLPRLLQGCLRLRGADLG